MTTPYTISRFIVQQSDVDVTGTTTLSDCDLQFDELEEGIFYGFQIHAMFNVSHNDTGYKFVLDFGGPIGSATGQVSDRISNVLQTVFRPDQESANSFQESIEDDFAGGYLLLEARGSFVQDNSGDPFRFLFANKTAVAFHKITLLQGSSLLIWQGD